MWLDASTFFVLNGILIEKEKTLKSAEFSLHTLSVVLGFAYLKYVQYIKSIFSVNFSAVLDERRVWCIWGRGESRVLVGNPEGKRPLGKSRPRWYGNIELDI
jgi:hypothetical protein